MIKKVALLQNVNYDSSNLITTEIKKSTMSSFINMDYTEAYNSLKDQGYTVYKIGNGTKVIDQTPKADDIIFTYDKVFLLTDSGQTSIPDFTGWTRKEIISYWNLSGIGFEINGSGIVCEQSISPGTTVNTNTTISVKLKQIDSYVEINKAEEENEILESESQ